MVKYSSKILFCLFIAGISITGCRKNSKYSDTPHLSWKKSEIQKDDSTGTNRRNIVLYLDFTDGDGDIGHPDGEAFDTCSASGYDLLIHYFEKVNQQFVEVLPPDACLPFHNRLPDLTPQGQNKTLEGTISDPFDYNAYPAHSNVDSIRFEVQLVDRAGHKSEIVTSPSIFVPPF